MVRENCHVELVTGVLEGSCTIWIIGDGAEYTEGAKTGLEISGFFRPKFHHDLLRASTYNISRDAAFRVSHGHMTFFQILLTFQIAPTSDAAVGWHEK